MTCKGARAAAHRVQLAQAMLRAVSGVPANEGANVVLISEQAVPLNDPKAERQGRTEIYGFSVRLAGDRPLVPSEDGKMEVGWGVGPKADLGTKVLSLLPSKGTRGRVQLSWAGRFPRGGVLLTKEDAAALGPQFRARGSSAGTATREGSAARKEVAMERAREKLAPEQHAAFDEAVAEYRKVGPPCFDAAVRLVKYGLAGTCGEGTRCAGVKKFVPCHVPLPTQAQSGTRQEEAPSRVEEEERGGGGGFEAPATSEGARRRRGVQAAKFEHQRLEHERTRDVRAQGLREMGVEEGVAEVVAEADSQELRSAQDERWWRAAEEEREEGNRERVQEEAYLAELEQDIHQVAALRFGAQMPTEHVQIKAREMLREVLEEAEQRMMPTRELALWWRRQRMAIVSSYRVPRPQTGHVRPRGGSSQGGSSSSSGAGSPMGAKQKYY